MKDIVSKRFKYIIAILFVFFSGISYSQALHLYGGKKHDVYLGCLNCSSYDSNSIWNSYGTYGSKYNDYSPWNRYSNNPPVVVDKEGNFYGYFSVNKYQSKRFESPLGLIIYEYYEEIREDVGEWYEEIFD